MLRHTRIPSAISAHVVSCRVVSLVTGNRAKMGGAVLLIIANERIEFNDCVFENNTVVTTGGAVMMSFNNLRITFNGEQCFSMADGCLVDSLTHSLTHFLTQ